MKKDRNCGMAIYPSMVPNYGGALMPGQMIPFPGGSYNNPYTMNTQNSFENDLSIVNSQINSLEQRISRLENMINGSGYSTNYNSNNYQMM